MRALVPILLLLATPFATAGTTAVADDAGQFEVRAAPAWVDAAAVTSPPAPAAVRAGIDGILEDHQIRVAGANVDEYFRRVRRVVTPAGVQNASELNIDFDPSYQRLVLHDVAIVRGATRIDQLAPDDVRIIEKEPESQDRIYDGQLTALIFLKDVRPGDLLDYSWSLEGSNPLLGGRYADEYDFGANVPTRLVRHRLVWPAGRPLHASRAAHVEHRGSDDVYVWERTNVQAVDVEDSTPDWYEPSETVQVTEYGSWAQVAAWANELFQLDDASRTAVEQVAAGIRASNRDRDAQLVAAIRFVQDDIRYLGIEMGRGSHEPRQPSAVLAQRYGDCKDKTLLLTALLRALGAEAYPALVNTRLRHQLDHFLPSPFLFDHVITEVIDRGKIYWVDGTLSEQGGTLATIDTPNDERALVVRGGSTALTRIIVRNGGSVHVDEVLAAERNGTTLEVTSTYSGREADDMRSHLATESLADVAKSHLNRYAADHPRIEPLGAPVLHDDRAGNVLVLRERYLVHDLWENGSWTYRPRAIEQHLGRPETLVRSMPLAIDYPLDVTERLIIRGGARPRIDEDSFVTDSAALHFEQRVDRGADLVITSTLRATHDAVPVAAVPDHLAVLNEISDAMEVPLEPARATAWPWALAAAVVLALLAAIVIYRRRLPVFGISPFAAPVGPSLARQVSRPSNGNIKGDSGNA